MGSRARIHQDGAKCSSFKETHLGGPPQANAYQKLVVMRPKKCVKVNLSDIIHAFITQITLLPESLNNVLYVSTIICD